MTMLVIAVLVWLCFYLLLLSRTQDLDDEDHLGFIVLSCVVGIFWPITVPATIIYYIGQLYLHGGSK